MYSETYANYAVDFVECLKHSDGEWGGKQFSLLNWQKKIVREFYGTIKDGGARQFQYLYLEIPKKNGKSEMAAALALFHTFADGESGGEVYLCAADKENAGIVFRAAHGMLKQCPALLKRAVIRESTRTIIDKATGTVLKVMSSEAYSKHGYKPSCVIFDELHAQPNRELWDVMTFGAGSARRQPVWIVLTTAGDDPDRNSIGWEIHEKARDMLKAREAGDKENDNPYWLPVIYGLPDDGDEAAKLDIYDEALWYRCNPSLGDTIEIDRVRQEALDAKKSEASERLFRWLRLNQWIAVKSSSWLPLTLYDLAELDLPRESLKGLKYYEGADLSSTTDLTARVRIFPPQKWLTHWYAVFDPYIPAESIKERSKRDHAPFEDWVAKGYVHATDGNCVDYDVLEADIKRSASEGVLKLLGADSWNCVMLLQHLTEGGLNVATVEQTTRGFSPGMKEMERLLLGGMMKHEKNPCARWCFGNTRCIVDGNENKKPMKNRSTGRIDVTVAWINAVTASMGKEEVDVNAKILSGDWSL